MFGGYSETKIKPMLKMAVSRFNMASNKKQALMKQQMREISKLLAESPPKEEKARIRAEALIRDDGTIEAMEILQLTCELLFERIKLITASKTCPEDLKTSISTLIWASDRVDIKELADIRKQMRSKFGKKFDQEAYENVNGVCNERIVAKLSVQPPTAYLVQTYLEKIADQFEVQWEPKVRLKPEHMAEPMAAPVGYSVQVAPGTGLVPVNAFPAPSSSNENDDDGGTSNGGNNMVPPPVVSTAPGSRVRDDDLSEIGSSSVVGGNSGIHHRPSNSSVAATRTPTVTATAAASMPSGDDDEKKDFDDIPIARVCTMQSQNNEDGPDIYIPPAPGAGGDKKPAANDDFDDLQARFNNLKK